MRFFFNNLLYMQHLEKRINLYPEFLDVFPPGQCKVFEEMFFKMDIDLDKRLGYDDIKAGFEKMGCPLPHLTIKDCIKLVNKGNDGKLTVPEFLLLIRKGYEADESSPLKKVWDVFSALPYEKSDFDVALAQKYRQVQDVQMTSIEDASDKKMVRNFFELKSQKTKVEEDYQKQLIDQKKKQIDTEKEKKTKEEAESKAKKEAMKARAAHFE
ncbi:unnamed protein product [Gordionus sp. m RMFG-2023]